MLFFKIKLPVLIWLFITGSYQIIAQNVNCRELIWADEFDSAGSPDGTKWNFETGKNGWGNNEIQNYTNNRDNSYVSNGTLKIHAKKSQSGEWTSARMVTSGKSSWKYGRFEMRARLPEGRGTWPAFWMMPQQSTYGSWPKSGEIDIMEHVGYDMNRIHGTIHTEAYNHSLNTQKGNNTVVSSVNSQFHIYAIEWSESEIKWYVNNTHFYTFKNENKTYREWPFNQPFFLILNIAIGGNWGGAQGIDPALSEAVMEVDYVRVYSDVLPVPVISGPSFINAGQESSFSTPLIGKLKYKWTFPTGVSIISGSETNYVSIKWNDKSGDVIVLAYNDCDTISSVPFSVQLQTKPLSSQMSIPFAGSGGNLLWMANPGTGNQINMKEENNELVVTYNIQNPLSNPYISYKFQSIADLTVLKVFSVYLKPRSGAAPYNIRFDLTDNNGNIDLNDIFKVENPKDNGLFNFYKYTFAMSSLNGWQPSKITEIRIYFNYGLLGKTGAGEFSLKDISLSDPNFTKALQIKKKSGVKIFPNPFENSFFIESAKPVDRVLIKDLTGRLVGEYYNNSGSKMFIDFNWFRPAHYVATVLYTDDTNESVKIIKTGD
jgi:beta-glucanase (GH16 family)